MAWKMNTARVLLALIGVTGCSTGLADEAAVPDETESALPDETESALAVVDEFIATANSGDVEGSLAFFGDSSGVIEANYFGAEGGDELFLSFTEFDGYKWLANRVAANSLRNSVACSADTAVDSVVNVDCSYESAYVVRTAVGARPLGTDAIFRVQDGTILSFEENVIANDVNVGNGYIEWLAGNDPEEASVAGLVTWQSLPEAVASGEAEARHADEYAAYLKENGCDLTGVCPNP